MTYQLANPGVIRIADGEHITRSHPDWFIYQAWVKDGNSPLPASVDLEPLDAIRNRLRSAVNQERNRREQSTFPYMGVLIDSDIESVIRINVATSAALTALMTGAEYSVDWTAADNSKVTMNAGDVLGMTAALATHGDALHQTSRALKDQIDALHDSEDRAGLAQFDPTYWPGDPEPPPSEDLPE